MPVQSLDLSGGDSIEELPVSMQDRYFQPWILALLLGANKLTSLSMRTDWLPWTPVLGLLSLQHLELTMDWVKPWLDVISADLSCCSCLETLKITERLEDGFDCPSMSLPDLFLHDVATLKSVDLLGWYPQGVLTLPPGCLLRLGVILGKQAQWDQCQRTGCPVSMLHLKCMKMRSWPTGIQDLSGLQYLYFKCKRMRDQDLAALQQIPHVSVEFEEFSTFLLTTGAWQTLEIWGYKQGFSISFSNVDAFVRGTKQFLFACSSQEAGELYRDVRAACMRQGVTSHECESTVGHREKVAVAWLSNVELCSSLIPKDDIWPSRATYPELYE